MTLATQKVAGKPLRGLADAVLAAGISLPFCAGRHAASRPAVSSIRPYRLLNTIRRPSYAGGTVPFLPDVADEDVEAGLAGVLERRQPLQGEAGEVGVGHAACRRASSSSGCPPIVTSTSSLFCEAIADPRDGRRVALAGCRGSAARRLERDDGVVERVERDEVARVIAPRSSGARTPPMFSISNSAPNGLADRVGHQVVLRLVVAAAAELARGLADDLAVACAAIGFQNWSTTAATPGPRANVGVTGMQPGAVAIDLPRAAPRP